MLESDGMIEVVKDQVKEDLVKKFRKDRTGYNIVGHTFANG